MTMSSIESCNENGTWTGCKVYGKGSYVSSSCVCCPCCVLCDGCTVYTNMH